MTFILCYKIDLLIPAVPKITRSIEKNRDNLKPFFHQKGSLIKVEAITFLRLPSSN